MEFGARSHVSISLGMVKTRDSNQFPIHASLSCSSSPTSRQQRPVLFASFVPYCCCKQKRTRNAVVVPIVGGCPNLDS